jgi:hypothetical protein
LQIADTLLVLVSTLGITFAMFGRCHAVPAVDLASRCLLAAVSFVVMFTPDMRISAAIAVVVAIALVVCIRQHRLVAPPKTFAPETGSAGPATGDLAPVLAEAKRDIG